jgi:hypothetical protein
MTLSSFLLFFGVLNALTPVVMLSTDDSVWNLNNQQRRIMRNMFVCGISLVFIALIWMFLGG